MNEKMTAEKAIEQLNSLMNDRENHVHRDDFDDVFLQDIEACKAGIQALEKLMPKKAESTGTAIVSKGGIEKIYVCPNCQKVVFRHEQMYGNTDVCYCKWCGQALDWSDENE